VYRLAFVHAPEAAGSSLRQQPLSADPSAMRFEGIKTDPESGPDVIPALFFFLLRLRVL